jgi:uncharacterized protein YqjF (DUF2071 family)
MGVEGAEASIDGYPIDPRFRSVRVVGIAGAEDYLMPTPEKRDRVRIRPTASPVMYQSWQDLLFLHWESDGKEIQRTLPRGLYVDRYQGRCFLGIVPFKMRRVRPRSLPHVPGISDFLELNLRTYVHDANGLPGVWFYSLDANQRLAVAIARWFFSLPYHWATMQAEKNEDDATVSFSSSRGGDKSLLVRYRYRSKGLPQQAQPGSLEFFLLERYVLFAETRSGLRAGRVHHEPYNLCCVELLEWGEQLLSLNGFTPPRRTPDHAVLSPGVDVSIYAMRSPGDALE